MGQLGSVHLGLKSNDLTQKGCIALLDPEENWPFPGFFYFRWTMFLITRTDSLHQSKYRSHEIFLRGLISKWRQSFPLNFFHHRCQTAWIGLGKNFSRILINLKFMTLMAPVREDIQRGRFPNNYLTNLACFLRVLCIEIWVIIVLQMEWGISVRKYGNPRLNKCFEKKIIPHCFERGS